MVISILTQNGVSERVVYQEGIDPLTFPINGEGKVYVMYKSEICNSSN